ncbi:deoxyribodipyrimidine photo-lyase [Pseudomonas sp. 5P_3.1_Bac2]|uniref:deoxyribodipyrimidine photo-lyase n=1 Tax=Pseudomonas sp. 5P_3.1_Bac2 TaxID=2971617 RepID=UPI0021C8EB63|nr:deoxyribodipyrimidine photo-lyase [Pseudomonas sp. 5P_3.1_Bac2]MCU1716361.1 deoxyribodipyrimidine photo-lyase [Pseudomonas sp. 5P_3.1_Bac2]
MQLLWLRHDLRLHDNSALHAAVASGPALAIYLITAGQWRQHDEAPAKVDFWLRNLRLLSTQLASLNIPLLIRQVDDYAGCAAVLSQVCQQYAVTALHFNQQYPLNEQRRDQSVVAALQAQGISAHSYLDAVLFAPGTILTKSGGFFQVYGQFRKACQQRLQLSLPAVLAQPARQTSTGISSDAVPEQVAGFSFSNQRIRVLWPAGEEQAQARLEDFCASSIDHYAEQRDHPAVAGTSQLGVYLAAGVLSPRQCLHAALRANQGEFASGNEGVSTWLNELLWREFYQHILVGYPRLSMQRAFRPETEALPWRHAPDELLAWQQGRTGVPLVDAAIRQLLACGWMHNRLRMVVAMFLTKNLLLNWREGERFFMRHLIDGDFAANNGGWQWSASTGTDSVPYFRIFNPFSQAQKFDPQGKFIKHWLPELAHLPPKVLHNPKLLAASKERGEYPAPMVDLAESRQRALAAFKSLKHLPRD